MVAQKNAPLAVLRQGRGLLQNVDDGEAILGVDRHEEPGHEGEVKIHVALIPRAKVGRRILGPLVRLGQKQPVFELAVDMPAQFFEERVRFRQIFTVCARAFIEVRDRVQP